MIIIQLDGWAVDPLARTISHGGKCSRISPKAMLVLRELLDAGGSVVPRDNLLDAAWPDVTVGEEVLTHAVAELRRAFEQTSGRPAPVRTVYKSGYQLSAAPTGSRPESERALASFAPFLTAQCLSERYGSDNAREAIRLYREALASDPGFSAAHSGLALKLVCCRFCYGGHPDSLGHALEHARMAIDLDRSSAEPYLAYGNALAATGDWDGAITSFKAAIRLGPNSGETFQQLGILLFRRGQIEAASAACDRAAALLHDDACSLLRAARARRALGDDAGSAVRMSKARGRVERQLQEEPADARARCQMFACMIEAGERDQALPWVEPLLGVPDSATSILVGGLAKSGEVDLALDQLEAAVDGGWSDSAMLAHDPDVANLKREPRFDRIVSHLR